MPTAYKYKVKDADGRIVAGSLEGDSIPVVATKLRQMGYVPINVEKDKAGMKMEISIPGLGNKVKLKEVAVFSRQFATMISSGVTLTRSLAILAVQAENKALAKVIDSVRFEVENGSSLSNALTLHPKVFNKLYVAMVRAGEVGGSLDRTLTDLAAMIEKQVELRGKIRSAMSYPVAVLAMVTLILSAMLIFVVPIFKKMYGELNGKLPPMTQALIAISNYAVKGLPFVIVFVVVGTFAYRKWTATDRGRLTMDRIKLRVPIMKLLVQKTAMSRFSSTLSTLLSSGVPVLEALDITMETVNNRVVALGIESIADGVKDGEPLTANLANHPVFPHMVSQMMSVGEETGALDALLSKIADFYDQEVSATVDSLTSLLEPLLIMVLGSAVGTMVISLYLPMFDIIKLVNQNGS